MTFEKVKSADQLGSFVEEFIQSEVEKRVELVRSENRSFQNQLKIAKKKELQQKTLIDAHQEVAENLEEMDAMRGLISASNFDKLAEPFELKSSNLNVKFDHEWDRAPEWLKMFIKYYQSKEKLLRLFKFFRIEHPEWAKDLRLPKDYRKDEILHLVKYWNNLSIQNSRYFEGNLGYYTESIMSCKGEPKKMVCDSPFGKSIPLQLLLANVHFRDPEVLDLVVEKVKKRVSHWEYFLALTRYHDNIDDKYICEMMSTVIDKKVNHYDLHKKFIEEHGGICVKTNPQFARHFKDKMSSQEQNSFYFLNYPLTMQHEFIKTRYSDGEKFSLINQLSISKEEKLELIEEFKLIT